MLVFRALIAATLFTLPALTVLAAPQKEPKAPKPEKVEEKFEILLARPTSVGNRAKVDIKAEEHALVQVQVKGRMVKNEKVDRKFRLIGVQKVISIDRLRVATAWEVTVEKFEVTDKAGTRKVAQANDVIQLIQALGDEQAQMTVNGTPASEEMSGMLDVVFNTTHDDEGNDRLFGTTDRVPVGANWTVNDNAAAGMLKRQMQFDWTVTGGTKLVKKVKAQGKDALLVDMALIAQAKPGNIPSGGKVLAATIKGTEKSTIPVAIEEPELANVEDYALDITTELPTGEGQDIEKKHIAVKRHRDTTFVAMAPETN